MPARRRGAPGHYMTLDRRQMRLWEEAMMPIQHPPQMPRTLTSPFGTQPPVKTRARRTKLSQHPAFDDTIPVDEEIR
jgi:hypothetical protein